MDKRTQEISANLRSGNYFKNGNNRFFRINSVTDTAVAFEEYSAHGPSDKERNMSRSVFAALIKNRSMAPIQGLRQCEDGVFREVGKDIVLERQLGLNRYLK